MKVRVQLLAHVRRDVFSGEKELEFVVRSERHDYWGIAWVSGVWDAREGRRLVRRVR